jgi:hypothetical protein
VRRILLFGFNPSGGFSKATITSRIRIALATASGSGPSIPTLGKAAGVRFADQVGSTCQSGQNRSSCCNSTL